MAANLHPQLIGILRGEGPLSPAELMRRLNISQPTLFRAIKAQPQAIIALGARRNRKIAALRSVRGLGECVPVFQVSMEGEIFCIGKLIAVYPAAFVFVSELNLTRPQYYPGLPYFLDDIRPQGFLGRSFTQKYPDLRLPGRTLDWSNDDILEAVARRGEDLLGNILVGAESFERFQTASKTQAIDSAQPQKEYTVLAQQAIDGQPAGSSAGGEHPKFEALTMWPKETFKRVLVKFSPHDNSFSAQRWRDLLICEWIAHRILAMNGIAAVESRIVEGGQRTFLETTRFDRVGLRGRKPILSLSALENEWTGHRENWSVSCQVLKTQKKITPEDFNTIQTLECFGRMIANTDRHSGNLSFFWNPGDNLATLAPVYDMLPMLYAPQSGGEDTNKIFIAPQFDYTLLSASKRALPMAIQYWESVRGDLRLSAEFIKIAEQNLRVLS